MLQHVRRWGAWLALGVLLVPAVEAPAAPVEGQQLLSDTELLDHDYAFRLQRPSPAWRLLDQGQIGKLNRDAVAGLVRHPAVWGAVVVEKLEGSRNEDYANLILEAMAIEDKQLVEKRTVELDGVPAVRVTLTGRVQDVDLRYRLTIAQRGGYVYQVIAWGLDTAIRDEELDPVAGAFRFTASQPSGRHADPVLPDAAGVGWRLENNVFTSAAYRVRAAPRAGWRLIAGEELARTHSDAEIALYHSRSESYLAVIAETARVEDPEAFLEFVRAAFRESVGGLLPSETADLLVDGRERTFDVYVNPAGPPVEYLHTVWLEDGIAYQILAWYFASARPVAQAALPAGLSSLAFLSDTDVAPLSSWLAGQPDAQSVVGSGFAMRRGRYLDFHHGVVWEKPSHGFWQARAGQEARAVNADASLVADDKASGLTAVLILERAEDVDVERYHDVVVRSLRENLGETESAPTRAVSVQGAVGQATRVEPRAAELPLAWEVVTFANEHVAGQLLLSSLRGNFGPARATIGEAIAGLEVHGAGLLETEVRDGRYRDLRMGFAVDLGRLGAPRDGTPPALAPIARLLSFGSGQSRVEVLAVFAAGDAIDESLFLDMATEASGVANAAFLRAARMEERPAEIDGHAATGRRWQLDERLLDIVIARRDQIFYAFVSHGTTARPPVGPEVLHFLD